MNKIQIIQGGQYGSEAKGAVAAHLAVTEKMDVVVRTGATNAGHTAYLPGTDLKFVAQQLPVGWIRKEARIVIGAGALVDPDILRAEIERIRELTGEDIRHRLMVDYRAYIHWPWHAKESSKSDRHALIGATGKGCSEAMISRLRLRGVEDFSIGRHADKLGLEIPLGDTEELLNRAWDEGAKIQLEGTQGQLLDLYLGPYPYTTHKQTGPGQWMSECGLSPSLPTDIVMVVRTYPIRVAGNSGPLPRETSWPFLARYINRRREGYFGLPPIVAESSIIAFEEAVRRVSTEFSLPPGVDGLTQHRWAPEIRFNYRNALSNLNARAFDELSPEIVADLRNLFEMTTVTKKLRRVAELDYGSLETSARQMRPHRVVVTFMNYHFPELWLSHVPITDSERVLCTEIGSVCGAPVVLVNRGPRPDHFIET